MTHLPFLTLLSTVALCTSAAHFLKAQFKIQNNPQKQSLATPRLPPSTPIPSSLTAMSLAIGNISASQAPRLPPSYPSPLRPKFLQTRPPYPVLE